MKQIKRMLALLLALALLPVCALADEATLTEAVRKALKGKNCTGAALIIAKDGEIVYEYYYGYAVRDPQTMVTSDTYFRVASATKMVSGIGLMTLYERGQIDLDEDISTYYGYTIRNPRFKDTVITPRMIMSHTSSFSDSGGYSNGGRSVQAMLALANKRTGNFTKKRPGTKYVYSNLNGGMLGSMIEAVTGQSINTVITRNVFEPLGVKAAYCITLLPDIENASASYFSDKRLKQAVSYCLRMAESYEDFADPDTHFRTTAGALWITAPSMMRICMMLEQGGTLDGVTILQPETVAMMMADQNGQPGITVSSPYGLNINRETTLLSNRIVYGHQGMSANMLCNVYFEPESHFCFVFISNGINNKMNNHVAGITRTLFRLTWNEFCGDQ